MGCVFVYKTTLHFCHAGKYGKQAIVEEEQCEDLLLFVELLGHHATMLEEAGEEQVPGSSVQLVDVLLSGTCLLLTFVNEELLKVQYILHVHVYVCVVLPFTSATFTTTPTISESPCEHKKY